ncbi:MAG: AAA family ATPase, partial [Oculatellaceae cyanobacterium Prado106]|nr:AAA family ATPase [Oculatellaceae cyanobacterium Prado106]
MPNDLQTIIERVVAGGRDLGDIEALATAIRANQLVLANGSGSTGIGGDVTDSHVVSGNGHVVGDRNTVIHISGADAQTIRMVVLKHSEKISMCNLPQEGYVEFVGRKSEVRKILDYLLPDNRRYIIAISGIGGVGKTALALNAAHVCWDAKLKGRGRDNIPVFDAIVFTSAKLTNLTAQGVLNRPLREGTLTDILLTIARVLDEQAITQSTADEQRRIVYEGLRKQRTLLIIDNLETMDEPDQEEVLAFLEDLPPSCKAIVTSRKQNLQRTHISLD